MPRFFAPISVDELKAKVEIAFLLADPDRDDYVNLADRFDTDLIFRKLGKDLKVKFDFENFFVSKQPNTLMGLHSLPNGLTCWGMLAGGNWQIPVFWVCYWDGKKIRGYVPEAGNPWDRKKKEAYNNSGNPDIDEQDWKLIVADIEKRILPLPPTKQPQTLQQRIEALEFFGCGDEAYELFQQTCSYCYVLCGAGLEKEAGVVCKWAESMAKDSKRDAEEYPYMKEDKQEGYWGR